MVWRLTQNNQRGHDKCNLRYSLPKGLLKMMIFNFPRVGHMDSFPATWIHAKVISLEIILRACLLDGKRGTTGLVVVAWGSMAFRWPSDPWKTNGWRAPKVDGPWKRRTPFKIWPFFVSMLDFGGVFFFSWRSVCSHLMLWQPEIGRIFFGMQKEQAKRGNWFVSLCVSVPISNLASLIIS